MPRMLSTSKSCPKWVGHPCGPTKLQKTQLAPESNDAKAPSPTATCCAHLKVVVKLQEGALQLLRSSRYALEQRWPEQRLHCCLEHQSCDSFKQLHLQFQGGDMNIPSQCPVQPLADGPVDVERSNAALASTCQPHLLAIGKQF